MLTDVIFGGFALLTAVLACCAARVVLKSQVTEASRAAAWKLFRAVWVAGTVTVTSGVIKLHQAGLI